MTNAKTLHPDDTFNDLLNLVDDYGFSDCFEAELNHEVNDYVMDEYLSEFNSLLEIHQYLDVLVSKGLDIEAHYFLHGNYVVENKVAEPVSHLDIVKIINQMIKLIQNKEVNGLEPADYETENMQGLCAGLIELEAEVDGVKVYPSVVKESE